MSHFSFIIPLAAFALMVIQYLFEVHVGSPTSMYDGESGMISDDYLSSKSTSSQFLGRQAPLQLVAIGTPLLAYDFLSAVLLLLVSLFLFCLCIVYREP